jgi:hypothetical protein
MASLPYESTPQTTNANRACRAVLGPCTDALRHVLRHYVPPQNFSHVIKQNKLNLPRLTADQRNLILPQNGSYTGSYNNMDLSLLYILLRNVCHIQPHTNGWGNDPYPSDRSLSANIDRVHSVWKQCVHSGQPSMSDSDFDVAWFTIRSALVDLDAFLVNGHQYEREVDVLRHESLVPEHQEIVQKQIKEDQTTRRKGVNLNSKLMLHN